MEFDGRFDTFLRPMLGKISCSPRYMMIAFFGFATACSGGLEPQRSKDVKGPVGASLM